jgi:4,5-dihydroxyphthalate decarboxylase
MRSNPQRKRACDRMTATLSFACGRYDRVAALFDGRVSVPGVRFEHIVLPPEELFPRALRGGEFDVFELSCGAYLIRRSQGHDDIVGVPIFLSRSFRHSGIYIRTDRGIAKPEDLRGRVLGVPDYWMTGAIWIRGLLADEHNVQPDEIEWRTGGLNRPRTSALTTQQVPPELRISEIGSDNTLSRLLVRGEIDGIITSDIPDSFGALHIGRLFADYRVAEQEYARRTGMHPIMHLVAIRRSVIDKLPHLTNHLMQALTVARDLAIADLSNLSAIHATLPWASSYIVDAQNVLGGKFWPYGIESNRTEIDTLVRYAFEQNLISRPLICAELFP